MSTYTIVGTNLQEVAKPVLYEYFKEFGALSDHIVRLKPATQACESEAASFTIHFRKNLACESALVGRPHVVGGVEVFCLKLDPEGAVAERKIFIKYLDKKATADDIRESMEVYGEVEAVHISMKKDKSMNLGLGNVLFRSKEAVERVLNDSSVVVRNKKVKVEPFKCTSSCVKNTSLYKPNSLRVKRESPQQFWTEPILQNHSKYSSHFFSNEMSAAKSKTALSVLEMRSLQDSDAEFERPSFRATFCPPISGLSKKGTSRDAKDSVLQETSTKYGDHTGNHEDQCKSLDFSLIEEECEESPRPRRGSEKCYLSPRAHNIEEKERTQQGPIISIHGGFEEVNLSLKLDKGSFHSVKPTSKTYNKNPRHHLIPLAKNHRESNLRLNRRFRNIERALLPGARTLNIMDVPRFRLF